MHDAYRNLASYFKLTSEDLLEVHPSDNRSKWENHVRQVRRHLVDMGILTNSLRGVLEFSNKGASLAEVVSKLNFTRESLANLVGSRSVNECKEIYGRLIDGGFDKVKALEIIGVSECKCLLAILEEV